MRGDEPFCLQAFCAALFEFPACAGMNRSEASLIASNLGVPRMRGDEPVSTVRIPKYPKSSPHARG